MSDKLTHEYIEEWRELARPLEELTGIKHSAFDPDVLFHYGRKSVDVPRWLLELINEGLARLDRESIGVVASKGAEWVDHRRPAQ